MMIDLTIIIPHYNSTNSLIKLLNSIPNKKNIEVIVIDDKSNKSEQIQLCHIYRNVNSNVKIIKNNTQKKGAGVCRNIGLKTAIGKWLLFADSDDFFVKSFYEKVEKYFNKDYEIIYFNPT